MKNTIQIISFIVFSIVFTSSYAQSDDLFMQIWKLKDEVILTSKASEKLEVFKSEKNDILEDIKELETTYFSKLSNGKKDRELKTKILKLYDKKHAIIATIKKEAIENGDEALFLELLEHIRPWDLKSFMEQNQLKDSHRIVFEKWLESIRDTEVGIKLQDFALKDSKGKTINTTDLKGKIFWIDSWASKCAPCIKKLKHLKPIYESYKDKGFEVVAVSWDYTKRGYIKTIDEAKADWIKVMKKHEFNWLNVFDHSDKIMGDQFGSVGKNLLVDEQGIIIGFDMTPLEIERILEQN